MMNRADRTDELQRRKQVRVRLRRNLEIIQQRDGLLTYRVLKDPVSLHYFRLEERQWFVVHLMDGTHTLEDIQQAYERAHRPDRLSLEELEAFTALLVKGGLAYHESTLAGRLLLEQSNKQWWQALQARLLGFLSFKIPVCNPDGWLTQLLPWVWFLFAPWFVVLSLSAALLAVGVVVTHWADFLARLPGNREFFSLHTLLYLWLALGIVKVLHELGHGLCCKAFGAEVPEMGILLLLSCPALYCNVSDSWKLPGRWQRMAIGSAGIYVELLIATCATFLWWWSDSGTVVHHLSLALMIVCSVHTVVFNGNPLLRFDGYHILADWLNVHNLAELSDRQLLAGWLRWLGVPVAPEAPLTRCRPWLLAGYAVASHVYRCVVFALSFYLLYQFLKPYKLGSVCAVLAVAGLVAVFAWPAARLGQHLFQQRSYRDMKTSRLLLAVGGLAVAAFVVWAVPFPRKVSGTAILQADPDQVDRLLAPDCGGFVRRILVRDGQFVREGEIVAVLDNPKLEVALRVNEADQELRRQQQQAQVAHLTESVAAEDSASGDLQQTAFEMQMLLQQYAQLKRQREQLTVRAPRSGVILGLESQELLGKWVERGGELCRVGNVGSLRAHCWSNRETGS